jgi:hypothetical protein
VIALIATEAKKALLQDGVVPIPQRWGERHPTLSVGPTLQPVLTPAVRAAARMIVRKTRPTIPMVRVIFAHRTPLPLAEKGPPAPPFILTRFILSESFPFTMHLLTF